MNFRKTSAAGLYRGRWMQTNRKGRGTRARMCVCVCVCGRGGGGRVWGFTGYKNNITRIASHFYSSSFIFSLPSFSYCESLYVPRRDFVVCFAVNSVTSVLFGSRSEMMGI